jgi:3',5'-cyclic AMP phosphodiesterase CpdA
MFTKDKDFAQETLNFELAIATANRLKPAFVVITGDLVNKAGDAAQIKEYLRIAGKLDKSIPLHQIPGNHDVENQPTPESIAAYKKVFGPDHYSFTVRSLYGIALNSSLIHSPNRAPELADAQERWLEAELGRARVSGARHIVVFQHHPWFLKDAAELDGYYNIPLARRGKYLHQFRAAGVRTLISGHYHRNAVTADGNLAMITTGPVGMPLGTGTQSGIRVVIVTDGGLTHRFYGLGELPSKVTLPEK